MPEVDVRCAQREAAREAQRLIREVAAKGLPITRGVQKAAMKAGWDKAHASPGCQISSEELAKEALAALNELVEAGRAGKAKGQAK